MPQRLKFYKNVLKFTECFIGYVKENTYENYRIRTYNILYYLEDDAIHVIEIKTENNGMTQGDLINRQRINYYDIQDPLTKRDKTWKDFNLKKIYYST